MKTITAGARVTIDENARDCPCVTHTGPHFLHMQRLWKTRNHRLGFGSPGFIAEESRRLSELADECVKLGVTHVPEHLT